jgi:Xaa-Pro aminopeptidase
MIGGYSMMRSFQERVVKLQHRLGEVNIDIALITDPDMIYYISGFWGFLSVQDFGRPVMVIVPKSGSCTLIVPALESGMARAMTWIEDMRSWMDGVGGEWVTPLRDLFGKYKRLKIGIERFKIPAVVSERLRNEVPGGTFVDISDMVAEMRMVKTSEEIATMRQAGQVAIAMCEAAIKTIGVGVPEYEVSLAAIAGGTRKAAEFLASEGGKEFFTPMIHYLQILMSGPNITMGHYKPTVRRIQRGDPVYMCFCGMTNFKNMKLGFDREVFVGTVTDKHAKMYETAIQAQGAALAKMRPGAVAEEVHQAANEVYHAAGFEAGWRTGRGVGYSFLEKPELKEGDKTILQSGMTFAVDGGVTIPGEFGSRVTDSVVVTETGFEYLTPFQKDLRVL